MIIFRALEKKFKIYRKNYKMRDIKMLKTNLWQLQTMQ